MVKRGDDVVVLWPRYFDRKVSRADGRRVSEQLAVREPDAKWIESAARKAGLSTTLEEDVIDPRQPFKKSGRVLIAKSGAKEATIKAVAAQMQDADR